MKIEREDFGRTIVYGISGPSYEAEHERMTLTMPCCGEVIQKDVFVDRALLMSCPDPAAFRAQERAPYEEALRMEAGEHTCAVSGRRVRIAVAVAIAALAVAALAILVMP